MLTWQDTGRFGPSSARDLPSPQPGRSQQMSTFHLSLEKLLKSTNQPTPFRLFPSSQQDQPAYHQKKPLTVFSTRVNLHHDLQLLR